MLVNDDQNPEQLDATTQVDENGTQIPKFKSAEDRDKAYQELERRAHEQAQELAEMKRKMEDFAASQAMRREQPQEQEKQFSDVYKSGDQLKEFWSRFAQNPDEVFKEREERLLNQWRQEEAVKTAARDAVSDFKAKHPDLAPYEEIVSVYVHRQPQNLSPRERLERAAPEARKMIASIAQRGAPQPNAGDPSTYVESPSGSREQSSRTVTKPQPEEDALAEYLREQNTIALQKATAPRTGHVTRK